MTPPSLVSRDLALRKPCRSSTPLQETCPRRGGLGGRLPWALALLLALCLGLAPATGRANPPEPPMSQARAMLLPVVDGYPAGGREPLLIMLQLPAGAVMAVPAEAGGPAPALGLRLEGAPGLGLGPVALAKPEQADGYRGRALVRSSLAVEPGATVGPRMVKAALTLAIAGRPPQTLEFVLGLEVLPAGQKPRVISPQMLARLGVEVADVDAPAAASAPAPGQGKSLGGVLGRLIDGQSRAEVFEGLSTGLMLVVAFLIGLALNLTPCVYPLIPITISLFGGRTGGSRPRLALEVGAYWLGMAVTYTVLGAMAALSGRMLGQWLTIPWVIVGLTLVFLLLASSMFGLWELRLPARLNRVGSANHAGVLGALFMGLTVGILAAPCIGPVVLGLMTHVAAVGRLSYGLSIFLLLSLGLGLPLSVLAFFSGSLGRLPGAGEWMIWVRKFFGVILVLMAASVARPLTGEPVFRWVLTLVGLAGGLYLGFWEKSGKGAFLGFKRVIGVLLVLAAAAFWWFTAPPKPAEQIAWTPYAPAVLAEAAQQNRPVVVDFTASWCAPCRQMEAETFPDPRVREIMANFAAVRVDVTSDPGPDGKRLMQQWRVRGVPTIAFLDRKGQLIGELTVVGFMNPDDFLDRLKMALARAGAPEK